MKTGDYEWCMTCDGDGRIGKRICAACGGLGCIRVWVSEEQRKRDMAEAAKLQATADEVSKRIAGDTKSA